jgi:hypothetical protein
MPPSIGRPARVTGQQQTKRIETESQPSCAVTNRREEVTCRHDARRGTSGLEGRCRSFIFSARGRAVRSADSLEHAKAAEGGLPNGPCVRPASLPWGARWA